VPERRKAGPLGRFPGGASCPAFCWSHVPDSRPFTLGGLFDRGVGLERRARREGGAARKFPRQDPATWWTPSLVSTESGVLGATGTYSRVRPEGSVGKLAHRAGGCAGPLVPKRRCFRSEARASPNGSEPPGHIPGSGSGGLQLYRWTREIREGHT